MRVTLCVEALEPRPGGIGRYTWQLCQGLAQRSDIDAHYFGRGQMLDDPAALLRGEVPRPRARRLRKLRAWLDRRAARSGLVHGPNYFLPAFADSGVITVHDLSVFRFPEMHPVERIRDFEQRFERSLGRAGQIITDTETIRRELIEDFGVAPERITAVHLGVDGRFRPQPDEAIRDELRAFRLEPKRYALCVSTLEPRKKIAALLKAWRRLPVELRSRYPLALAGGIGWLNDDLRTQVEASAAEGWLHPLGFVEEDRLPALYAGAALFVYPSVYEGFGLPPLEAMASGAPVLVASRSCLPEVCGEAADYLDPDDPDHMLATISGALSDEAWRTEAARKGIERARLFTWDQCIERTIDVYRKVGTPS